MTALYVRDPLGLRRFERGEFPLSIGGAGCAIVIAAAAPGVLAYLALQDEQLFIQAVPPAIVLLNGTPLNASTWLREGDVLDLAGARLRLARHEGVQAFEVTDVAQANVTAPPVVTTVAATSAAEEEPLSAIQFRARQAAATEARGQRHLGRFAVGLVALVLAGIIWFVFSANSLVVSVQPASASVDVTGPWPRVGLGSRYLVRAGEYEVHASAPGHRDAQRSVRVERGASRHVAFALPKLPGKVRIATVEPVQVRADGKTLGTSPGPFELAAGKHRLELVSERYLPATLEVDVAGEGREQTVQPQLVPNWAEVSIASEPSGASVRIGDQQLGTTPLKLQLPAGHHKVELQRAGFTPWTSDVQVRANEPLTLGPIRLGLPDGKLDVRSSPAGASVSVAGVYRGKTPLQIALRPEMTHSLTLTLAGHQPATQNVAMQPGEQRSVTVPLQGIYGEVTVRAQPADAELFVNGQSRGTANQKLQLVTAAHTIEVRNGRFKPLSMQVQLQPGEEMHLKHVFAAPPAPARRARPKEPGVMDRFKFW